MVIAVVMIVMTRVAMGCAMCCEEGRWPVNIPFWMLLSPTSSQFVSVWFPELDGKSKAIFAAC